MFWSETIRRNAQTMMELCTTTDPKIWEQRLTDYLAKVSYILGTDLDHASLSGR